LPRAWFDGEPNDFGGEDFLLMTFAGSWNDVNSASGDFIEESGGRSGEYFFTEDTTTTLATPISPNSAEGAAKSCTLC
jgi:hypothetical protein